MPDEALEVEPLSLGQDRGCHMAGEPYEEYSKLRRLGHMGHVREYTALEVAGLLEPVGIEVDDVLWRFPDALPRGLAALPALVERMLCLAAPAWRPHFTIVGTRQCDAARTAGE